ncbi:hypothetical protein EDB19DRAFT_1838135 [Suillus lakei]|nr:hypothetical protein EDB19DRAFT_1838135 [Suillus lakei]
MSLLTVNNAMPRALCISEILSNIISFIHIDFTHIHRGPVPLSGRDFLALALTCRAFLEPALNALWESINGIIPFMQCGEIIMLPKTTPGDDDEYCMSQLARIGRYANRVRFFDMTHITFEIKEAGYAERVQTVLQSLPSSCPLLESISIVAPNLELHFPLSAHAIQKLQKLRKVNVPVITKDALIYLGGLSSVTEIRSHLPTSSDLEDIIGSSCSPGPFQNIDNVDWEIQEWRDVEVFIHLWPHKLTSLQLRSKTNLDPGLMQVLFDSLRTREAFRYLRSICLTEYSHGEYSNDVIAIDTIRPLFYLSHLRIVDIDTKSCLNIDEGDLMEMAEAWPCLEVLFLNEMVGHLAAEAPMPRISLADVDEEYGMEEDQLLVLEPRDSHATLKSLKLRCARDDEETWKLYSYGASETVLSEFQILFTKLFPGHIYLGVMRASLQFSVPLPEGYCTLL